jgi:hypothetical protein
MEGAEILQLLAELAVGVLGFSGVVAVLGRRGAGEWAPEDRSRFFWMVWATALVLVSSLIPFLLHHGGIAGPPLWGWCSAIAAAACTVVPAVGLYIGSFRFFNPSGPGVSKLAVLFVWPAMFVTPLLFALNAFAIGFDRTFAPYLAALLLAFGSPIILFIRLLYSAIGPPRATP